MSSARLKVLCSYRFPSAQRDLKNVCMEFLWRSETKKNTETRQNLCYQSLLQIFENHLQENESHKMRK